jgi:hypothetical protein
LVNISVLLSRKPSTNPENKKEVQKSNAGGLLKLRTFLNRRERPMRHKRKKSKGTWRLVLLMSFLLVVAVALILGAPVTGVWA